MSDKGNEALILDLETRLATKQAEREAMENAADSYLKQMKEEIKNDPRGFSKWVCESVLGEEEWVKNNLSSWGAEAIASYKQKSTYHSYFAQQILNQLNEVPKVKPSGYISLRQWIERNCSWLSIPREDEFNDPYYESVWVTFFNQYLDEFNSQIHYVTYMVYFGVPLYEKVGDEFRIVENTNENYQYLKLRGKYDDITSAKAPPSWADKYYIHTDHEALHYKMDWDEYKSEEERDFVRESYRRAIGVPLDSSQGGIDYGRHSRLSAIMEKVIARFYGPNFDPNDSDTWPRQVDIVEWLQSAHHLSKREAEAIDIVTRPDRARNK